MTAGILDEWLRCPDPARFPFDAAVRALHRSGKHHADAALLDELAAARSLAREGDGADADRAGLMAFLDIALDKRDHHYDYTTYTAVALLDLPGGLDAAASRRRHDRLTALLVSDLLGFELDALDGLPAPLPRMRAGPETVAKRCRSGLRVLAPILGRLGLPRPGPGDPFARARATRIAVATTTSPAERRMLARTILPVDTIHDEYMFIRVLQSFEAFFGQAVVHLEQTVEALTDGDAERAAACLDHLTSGFHDSAPLFTLLATMRVEAFRTFRVLTEGASAIQSVGYKTMESLCRRPDPERLASIAYDSVPTTRERIVRGQSTVDEALAGAVHARRLDLAGLHRIAVARERFADAYRRWRRTHYRLAARMLGDSRGSGYTQGVPYLADLVDLPVFDAVEGYPFRSTAQPARPP